MKLEIPVKNIAKIVDYIFDVEEKHYFECKDAGDNDLKKHIFYDLFIVRNWLRLLKAIGKWKFEIL